MSFRIILPVKLTKIIISYLGSLLVQLAVVLLELGDLPLQQVDTDVAAVEGRRVVAGVGGGGVIEHPQQVRLDLQLVPQLRE